MLNKSQRTNLSKIELNRDDIVGIWEALDKLTKRLEVLEFKVNELGCNV